MWRAQICRNLELHAHPEGSPPDMSVLQVCRDVCVALLTPGTHMGSVTLVQKRSIHGLVNRASVEGANTAAKRNWVSTIDYGDSHDAIRNTCCYRAATGWPLTHFGYDFGSVPF